MGIFEIIGIAVVSVFMIVMGYGALAIPVALAKPTKEEQPQQEEEVTQTPIRSTEEELAAHTQRENVRLNRILSAIELAKEMDNN